MKTSGQFLSPTRQAEILPFETAERPIVGFSRDYPSGLLADFHTHPRAQLLYAISGVMRVETHATSYLVPPTSALLLPSNIEYAVRMDGPVAMRQLFVREDAMERIRERTSVIVVSPLLRELIVAVCAEPLEWETRGRGHYLAELIIDEIIRSRPMPLSLQLPRDMRLRRVVAALREQPHDPRGLEEWAEVGNASSRTLARLFRAETGLSFRQWRQQARLTEALSALTLGATPARAAKIAGFESVPAFGVAFREFFGMTPGQARTLNHQTASFASNLSDWR
ncbi:AraC family transcriptional regulator [Mesorhizobium sp. B2-5-13]|uniref:AraC family transcriptional regulator n=1 Tax=unclassified Mesorhizobium TaxID=325217 RepID=UPI00112966DC|nr:MULTISPECIES: helix-turn-helix transcriptional regulator [unclassified Mesorhizobium]TPJ78783.1 AraC family transcriptional regulator [Mesorhizobium sp. B2-5-13]TPK45009.1 AraC family transcriptional regulator [Mesorhizobium sp. B2-5-5]